MRSVSIRRECFCAYRRSSATLERVARVRRLVGEQHGAERAADLESLAVLRERGARAVDQLARRRLRRSGR